MKNQKNNNRSGRIVLNKPNTAKFAELMSRYEEMGLPHNLSYRAAEFRSKDGGQVFTTLKQFVSLDSLNNFKVAQALVDDGAVVLNIEDCAAKPNIVELNAAPIELSSKKMIDFYYEAGLTRELAAKVVNFRKTSNRNSKGGKFRSLAEFAKLDVEATKTYLEAGLVKLGAGAPVEGLAMIELNTATKDELCKLDGVGEKVAEKILAWIAAGNRFEHVEDLDKVARKGTAVKALMTKHAVPYVDGEKIAERTPYDLVLEELMADHHEIPESLRKMFTRAGEKGKTTIVVPSLTFVESSKYEFGFVAKINVSAAPISLFSLAYADDSGTISLTSCTGHETYFGDRPVSNRMAVVDYSGVLKTATGKSSLKGDLKEQAAAMVKYVMDNDIVAVRYGQDTDGHGGHMDFAVKQGDFYMSLCRSEYNKATRTHVMAHYDVKYVEENTIMVMSNQKGMMFSTAQGRMDHRTFFDAQNQAAIDKFTEAMDLATFGEYSLRVKQGKGLTQTMLVDAATRLSSHLCGMGMRRDQHVVLRNMIILFKKDGNIDGHGYANVDSIVRMASIMLSSRNGWNAVSDSFRSKLYEAVRGMMIQLRPYTAKGTVLNISSDRMRELEVGKEDDLDCEGFNLYVLDYSKPQNKRTKKEREAFAALAFKMTKGADEVLEHQGREKEAEKLASFFKGYDGVKLVYGMENADEPADILGDLNFWKDAWDYTTLSGLNALLTAHWDGDYADVYTSAQMLKVAARLALEHGKGAIKDFKMVVKKIIDKEIDRLTNLSKQAKPGEDIIPFRTIDTSYITGLLKKLNGKDLEKHPDLLRPLIKDVVRTISSEITLDRYPMHGHSGMIAMDISYTLLKAWRGDLMTDDIPEDVLLNIHEDGVIETIDPVADKYFDELGIDDNERYGFGTKYPAVGTRESALLFFLSPRIVAKRITEMKGLTIEQMLQMASEISHMKYGAIMFPADLDTLGMILAGLDRDGDKICITFGNPKDKDLVWFMRKYGFMPIAVSIGKHGITGEKTFNKSIGLDTWWSNNNAVMIQGNEKTGPITNGFSILIQPLCADWDRETKKLYLRQFAKAFKMGTAKDGKLTSIFKMPKVKLVIDGKETLVPAIDFVKAQGFGFEKASTIGRETYIAIIDVLLPHMKAFTGIDDVLDIEWAELTKITTLLDVLGRHSQELGIDAAKKFFKVDTGFLETLRQNISLIRLRFGIEIEVDWKNILEDGDHVSFKADGWSVAKGRKTHLMVDGKEVVGKDLGKFVGAMQENPFSIIRETDGNDIETVFFPDFMSEMRRYAANAALAGVKKLVAIYKDSLTDPELVRARKAMYVNAMAAIPDAARKTISYVEGMAKTVHHAYADRQAALRGEYLKDGMDTDEKEAVEADIRKQLHTEFDDLMGYIDNQIRLVAMAYGIAPDTLIAYLFGDDNGRGGNQNSFVYAGQLLKAETAYFAIKNSSTNVAREEIRVHGLNDDDAKAVKKAAKAGHIRVEDGNVSAWKASKKEWVALQNAYVSGNVLDGVYGGEVLDGKAYVTAPLTDFVELPEADDTMRTLPLFMKNAEDGEPSAIEKIQAAHEAGKKLAVRIHKVPRRDGKFFENPAIFTEDGEFLAEIYAGYGNGQMDVAKTLYLGTVGDLMATVETQTTNEKGIKRFGFVVLRNVMIEDVEDAEPEEEEDNNFFFNGEDVEIEMH